MGTSPWFDLQPGVTPPTRKIATAEPLGHHALQLPSDRLLVKDPARSLMPQTLLRRRKRLAAMLQNANAQQVVFSEGIVGAPQETTVKRNA